MLYTCRLTALTVIPLLVTLFIAAGSSGAAEIRVLSAGAALAPEKELAAEFTKETGHRVSFTFGSPGAIQQKVAAGETFDLVVMEADKSHCLTLHSAMIFWSRSLGGNGISHHWTGKQWQRDSKTSSG